MKLKNIEWLFFDLGSTLIDESESERRRTERLAALLAESGIEASIDKIRATIDQASRDYAPSSFREAVRRLCRSDAEYEFLCAATRYSHDYERLYPDAAGVLERLAGRYRIGFIANQGMGAEKRLEAFGIRKYFSLCFSSAETGMEKPDPGLFRLALAKADCKAERAVMIGDRLDTDVYPARRIGMRTVRVLRGVARVQTPVSDEYRADHTIEDLSGLFAIL